MASDMFKNLVFGFVLLTLFSSLIIAFVVSVGVNNYDMETEDAFQGAINPDDYDSVLQNNEADDLRQRFESGEINDIDSATGVFGVVTDIGGMIISPFLLLAGVMTTILKVPSIVTTTILTLIVLTIVLGIWRLIRAGD